MIEVEVEEFGDFTEVRVKTEKWSTRISVYPPRKEFGEMRPAKINWPCCGSQEYNEVAAFIEGLLEANKIAQRLNLKAHKEQKS